MFGHGSRKGMLIARSKCFFFTNLVQKLIEASCFVESLLIETNRRFSECGICI